MQTVAFLAVLLFGIVLMFSMVENEKPGFATISLLATALAFYFCTGMNPFLLALQHPLLAVLVLVGYFVVGVLWSVAKWWFFVRGQAEEYYKCRQDFLFQKKLPANTVFTPELLTEFHEGTIRRANPGPAEWPFEATNYGSNRLYRLRQRPSVRANKYRILTWMMFWPWSATWTIINDPVKKLFKEIFNRIKSVYENVANNIYKDIDPL